MIGGGDWTPRQLIYDTIAAFLKSQSIVLRHPQAVPPWQHVLDCLGGYVRLAEALSGDARAYSGAWNFGPTDAESRSVSYIVESLAAEWGIERPWVQDTVSHPPEENLLRLDVTKTANRLGWRCQLGIDEALRLVAGWYRRYHSGQDARGLCLEQMSRYLEGR